MWASTFLNRVCKVRDILSTRQVIWRIWTKLRFINIYVTCQKNVVILAKYFLQSNTDFIKKNIVLFVPWGRRAKRMHRFFLAMISSRHIVSTSSVPKLFIYFTIKPLQTKTIPPPLELRPLLSGGNWYMVFWTDDQGNLHWVLFRQRMMYLWELLNNTSLRLMIFSLKEFILMYPKDCFDKLF